MQYKQRLQKLCHILKTKNISLLLIDDPIDLYYLTGLSVSRGRLFVGTDESALLLVDGRYLSQCQRECPFPVALFGDQAQLDFASQHLEEGRNLGFDSTKTTYADFFGLKSLFETVNIQLCPLETPIQMLRICKDKEEVALLREATNLCSMGFDYAKSLLNEGVSEKYIATELEIYWKRRGGEQLSFDCIIAFGGNSAMPHHRAGDTILTKNQIVLIDIGIRFRHYHSDMTRTLFYGKPSEKMQEIYAVVKEAQKIAMQACKPGVTAGELDLIARNFITQQGYGREFSHGLGHGVGLEIHEAPFIKNIPIYRDVILKSGMVITIEPGIYLNALGGVRIENMIHITPEGYEDLTKRSTDLMII